MKKTIQIIGNVLVWLLVITTVCMMIFTLVSMKTMDQNNRGIFGYSMFIVQSDSMKATDFAAGDLVLINRNTDPATFKEGDIIAFISKNSYNFGETVTHKIRSRGVDSTGDPYFVTYGTTTGEDDEAVVSYPSVIGLYKGHIPAVGYFLQFLKTPAGYFWCILLPFALLLLYQGFNCVHLFRKYKKEQMEAVMAERTQLENERKQNAEMMQELLVLRAQLEHQAKVQNDEAKPEPIPESTESTEQEEI